jgi:membrane protease YdiL (CAAX protease family)
LFALDKSTCDVAVADMDNNLTVSSWFAGALGFLWLGSILTWIRLFAFRRERGHFLPYEPRVQVPWGSFIALLTVLFVAASIFSSQGADPQAAPAHEAVETNASDVLYGLLAMIASQAFITSLVLIITAVASQPTLRDLGIPTTVRDLARDIKVGAVAFLAAIVPVHGLQVIMLVLFGMQDEPPSHPLVEMIAPEGPDVTLFLVASFMAVVMAPLSEEVFFRLIFQGWLEKREARRLVTQPSDVDADVVLSELSMAPDNVDLEPTVNEPAVTTPTAQVTESPPPQLPTRGLAGLPYGWFPILISSLLFAAAHFGHGVDPFAIFVLALILGYVYQRTHRIVPCIVTHMLFNAFAMLVLWQLIFVNAE